MHIDMELATVLTDQYNGYASATEEFMMLDEEWVLERLVDSFDPADLDFLVDDDFGRGLIMGQLLLLRILELEKELASE